MRETETWRSNLQDQTGTVNPDDRVAYYRRAQTECSGDLLLGFCRYYFPEAFTLPWSRMHRELADDLMRMLGSQTVEREAIAAPRGNAKTTLLVAFIAYCAVYEIKHFILYITSTAELADAQLVDLAHDLEDNPRLREDFPEATGRGRLWRQNVIVTRNGVRILALGAQKKIRGRKHRHYRPDLFVLDDLEDDEHVRNLDQRNKMHGWLTKAVLKARGVAVKADYILAGTLLHHDSVLARVLDTKQSPGWLARTYRAVIRWADNGALWDQWEKLYCDWHHPDDERHATAAAFYREHQVEMLAGTEVLWPEGEPYYDLMRQRVDDGPTAFQTEKQNQPLDASNVTFPEEWFEWFDEIEREGEFWLMPEHGDGIRVADCDLYGACDPSMGRRDKHSDPSAICTIAAYPSQNLPQWTGRYQTFWVLDGDIARRHPHVIEDRIFELHALRHYQRFGVETIQFQQLFADNVRARSLADPAAASVHIVGLKPNTDKTLRIQKLSPYVYSRRMRFSRRVVALYDQMHLHPQHAHDDGPDALELCMETIGEIGWVVVSDGDKPAPRSGSLNDQVRERLPQLFPEQTSDSCGNCLQRGEREGRPWCQARRFYIKLEDPACQVWEGKG